MARQSRPLATFAVVAICVIWTARFLWGEVSIADAGAINSYTLWEGEWWRLATSVILHGSVLHLVMNGLSLYFLGRVLEIAIGRPAYLFFLGVSAAAGMAASLLWMPGPIWRVGISGGVLGLVGLILALEWAITNSAREFFQQRNTRMVFIILALNVGLAFSIGTVNGMQIDHAGHIGGLLIGLLAGLAFYTRRGIRPIRGVAVALLLVAPALAYAAGPVFSVTYHWFRYDSAQNRDEREVALRGVLGVDDGNVRARRLLAVLADDPSILEPIPIQKTALDANRLVAAWLALAERRLERAPEEAAALAERAAAVENAVHVGWLEFGMRAEEAGQAELAKVSFERAYEAMKAMRRAGLLWRPAWERLKMLEKSGFDRSDPEFFTAWLKLAGEAAGGLRSGNPDLALTLRRIEEEAETIASRADDKLPYGRPLAAYLARLAAFADEDGPRIADLDIRMAIWWWLGALDHDDDETLEMARGRFETAWQSAFRTRNFYPQALAESWLKKRGFPLPEPELAEEEDGG